MEETKSSMMSYMINFVMIGSIGLMGLSLFLAYEQYVSTYQISKAKFICTKIEQVGKNMDDVVCVQYTEQKFAKSAIEQSKALAYLSK